mgnify:FL=1
MASTYLTRTLGSSSNSGTISMWVKRSKLATTQYLYANLVSGTNYGIIFFDSNDRIEFMTVTSGSHTQKLLTTRKFRDTGAWYHFVFATDTDNSTATNRLRLYVNGVEETAFDTDATGSQGDTNYLFQASATNDHVISGSASQSDLFDGLMAHIHIVPGSQLAPTVFGETDSTSGIWVPKTNPSVTYTAQGSFLKFENSAAMGTDSSGNSNTWTVGGSMTQNVDSPTNNYATLTPLYTIEYNSAQFFTNGNNTTNSNQTQWNTNPCTMEVSSGKWYFEGYGHTNGSNYVHYGITSSAKMNANATQAQSEINGNANGYAYGYYGYNGQIYYSTLSTNTGAAYGNTYGSSDYIGIFADLDNNKLYFAKNGTLQNSGTGYDINADGKPYILATAVYSGLTNVNFGSGVFGTTALTGTTYADANGHGTFKYSPNQGGAANFDSAAKNFYAMNTKNLKEFG